MIIANAATSRAEARCMNDEVSTDIKALDWAEDAELFFREYEAEDTCVARPAELWALALSARTVDESDQTAARIVQRSKTPPFRSS